MYTYVYFECARGITVVQQLQDTQYNLFKNFKLIVIYISFSDSFSCCLQSCFVSFLV